jgi:hypothetical protein
MFVFPVVVGLKCWVSKRLRGAASQRRNLDFHQPYPSVFGAATGFLRTAFD